MAHYSKGREPRAHVGERVTRLRRLGNELLLQLENFSASDLQAIRSIHGRRWDRDQRVWCLPYNAETCDAVARAFGVRVDPPVTPAAGSPAERTEPIVEAMRRMIRTREYSRKTERSYLAWVKRFIAFHAVVDAERLNASHATAFL